MLKHENSTRINIFVAIAAWSLLSASGKPRIHEATRARRTPAVNKEGKVLWLCRDASQ
jgi:hypothetical protein